MSAQRSRITCRLIAATVACLIVSCASSGKKWQVAAESDDIASYRAFLVDHPRGPFADSARARIETLVYQDAVEAGTAEAYRSYLSDYPTGKYRMGAGEMIETIDYESALQTGTIEAVEQFLSAHPHGSRAREITSILDSLNSLKDERDDYERAIKGNTMSAYESFLDNYPSSEFASEIRDSIQTFSVFTAESDTLLSLSQLYADFNWNGYKTFRYSIPNGVVVSADSMPEKATLGNVEFLGKIDPRPSQKAIMIYKGTRVVYKKSAE